MLSTPAKDYPQFEAALSLMPALPPDEVASLLNERLERLRTTRESVDEMLQTARQAGIPRLFTIEHDYELAILEVEEEFVERLLRELDNGELNGLKIWTRSHELRASGHSEKEIDAILREELPDQLSWLDRLDNRAP